MDPLEEEDSSEEEDPLEEEEDPEYPSDDSITEIHHTPPAAILQPAMYAEKGDTVQVIATIIEKPVSVTAKQHTPLRTANTPPLLKNKQRREGGAFATWTIQKNSKLEATTATANSTVTETIESGLYLTVPNQTACDRDTIFAFTKLTSELLTNLEPKIATIVINSGASHHM